MAGSAVLQNARNQVRFGAKRTADLGSYSKTAALASALIFPATLQCDGSVIPSK